MQASAHRGDSGTTGRVQHFYRFKPPRPLEEIEADIGNIGAEIVEMLREVARTPYGSES